MRSGLITENQLDDWVRSNAGQAQGLIVELVWRLVVAASPHPKERRFPLGDSIGQHGPDGYLSTECEFAPFVPDGVSYWEVGTNTKPGEKATSDYRALTDAVPASARSAATFVFVTPLSGRRAWQFTWKPDAQATWSEQRRQTGEWQDVRVIDGCGLVDWMHYFPAVERWLAQTMGIPAQYIQTPEQRWSELSAIGNPVPLIPDVFTVNRDAAADRVRALLSGELHQLRLDTRFPAQAADFVAAFIASLDQDTRADAANRCLIVSSVDAWIAMASLDIPHVLVADFDLDGADALDSRLLERAHRAGHAVIFAGLPGGMPQHDRVAIPQPSHDQINQTLVKAGFREEHARTLAMRSNGNLDALRRCLQSLPLAPDWAHEVGSTELAIAQLLGAWTENVEADTAVVSAVSGMPYSNFVAKMREITLRAGTPLIQRQGTWRVVSRWESWHALGSRLFDEHLDRFRESAVGVLQERDPKFDLEPDERFAANIYGKVPAHSLALRNGLAESLAILGSHPNSLTSCSLHKAQAIAVSAVRAILKDADWELWGSLNDLLPLLAEAAPTEFLDAVELALSDNPCPFDAVFAQEGKGLFGSNYMSGLLWALETLAWSSEHLVRVVVALGELAERDPGGKWANRPANSLAEILLPWLPHTCASPDARQTAIAALMNECPNAAWQLLLASLPMAHQVSHGTRKPAWREFIPSDWVGNVTHREYWEQTEAYARLAISAAQRNPARLIDLVDRVDVLPRSARVRLFDLLRSDTVGLLPRAERLRLWTELTTTVSKHRRFPDAKWAMPEEAVAELAAIAESLKPQEPVYLFQRLFTDRDYELYERNGDFEAQRRELDDRRQRAVDCVFQSGQLPAVRALCGVAESPGRVGYAFAAIAPDEVIDSILPGWLGEPSLNRFMSGFIGELFQRRGWRWVDGLDMTGWSQSQKGQMLVNLPFCLETWHRVSVLLEGDESLYWAGTAANPYEADGGIGPAIDRLLLHGRPHEALRCVEYLCHSGNPLGSQQAIDVLRAILDSEQPPDTHAVITVIKKLQDDQSADTDEISRVEWMFLPLLRRHNGAAAKTLEHKLAADPEFFCEVVRAAFVGEAEQRPSEGEISEQQRRVARNAYDLLHEWRTPPGSEEGGPYNSQALITWITAVKEACTRSGHLGPAQSIMGQVLIYVPADPSGLWLHHGAAAILNAKDSDRMRTGFRIGLSNSRGTYWGSNGRDELELASKYRAHAEAAESHGYHRLATTVRELAEQYQREAASEALRGLLDD